MNLDIKFTPEMIALIIVVTIVSLIVLGGLVVLYIKKIKPNKFKDKWNSVKSKLSKQERWQEALLEADNLLDLALKKKKYTGKTVGEKLVKAEKVFTNKDEVWLGHKLSKRAKENPDLKLKKADMKRALKGLQQGLKDLGAL